MKLNTLLIICGLTVTGLANAECPSSLNKDDMAKCQEIEKTGITYQAWQKTQTEMAGKSTISPITGKDVKTVAPAAGKAASMPTPSK